MDVSLFFNLLFDLIFIALPMDDRFHSHYQLHKMDDHLDIQYLVHKMDDHLDIQYLAHKMDDQTFDIDFSFLKRNHHLFENQNCLIFYWLMQHFVH